MFRTIKNILYVLSGSLFRIVLFLCITAAVLMIVFGSSKTLKTTMQTSNAYNRFVPSVIESNKKNPQTASALPYDDPKITNIFLDSFPANDLKLKTETVIDSAYSWLNKDTDKLQFRIDFTKNKHQLSQELADYAFNRLERLPMCKVNPAELDPLTAVCQPKNAVSPDSKKAYEQQIFLSDSFLQKTVLSQDDLPKNSTGQSITQQLYFLPNVFTWLKRSPYILGALSIILAVDFILLSPRRRKGVQRLSAILVSSGVSILMFPLIYSYIIPYFSKSFQFSLETDGTQKIFSEIIDKLNRNIDILFISIGAAIFVVGFILYAAERLTRPQSKYHDIEKMAGVATGIKKVAESPKSLKGKLSQENIPLQSSDKPRTKSMKTGNKYRKLKKKEF